MPWRGRTRIVTVERLEQLQNGENKRGVLGQAKAVDNLWMLQSRKKCTSTAGLMLCEGLLNVPCHLQPHPHWQLLWEVPLGDGSQGVLGGDMLT